MSTNYDHRFYQLAKKTEVSQAFTNSFDFKILNRNTPRDDIERITEHHHDVIDEICDAVHDKKFNEAAKLVDVCFEKRLKYESGEAIYTDAVRALLFPFEFTDLDSEESDEAIATYEEWYNNNSKSPFAAGTFVLALGNAGFLQRGTAYWAETAYDQKKKFRDSINYASGVILTSVNRFSDDWYWNYCLHKFSIIECPSFNKINSRFKKCVSFDQENRDFYEIQAHAMLQRWFGDKEDMQEVARLFMENTAHTLGKRGYAEILDYGFSMDGPESYEFDGVLMRESVKEKLDHKWSQFTLTRYASCLFYMGEFKPFLSIMKNKLKRFYPEAWISLVEPHTACKIAFDILKEEKAKQAA